MRHLVLRLSPVACLLAATAWASPAPITATHVDQALAALSARDGQDVVLSHADGWTLVNEPAAAAQWSFTPSGHPAHPAVVRRVIERSADGRVQVHTDLLCEGPAEACDTLRAEFLRLNARVEQATRSRSRTGGAVQPAPQY